MYNFFVDEDFFKDGFYFITGEDYNHIKNVLRMRIGEEILVSKGGKSDLCVIENIDDSTIKVRIEQENFQDTNLPIKIHLFQGLPKSDKMELIIQKAVELGAHSVTPVEMNRCIVKLDDKKKISKRQRWQSISQAAAKQSKRNFVPEICEVLSYKEALKKAAELDVFLVPYENEDGMESTKKALSQIKSGMNVGILIGPEGGFEPKEIENAVEIGGNIISLGSRILRTETAAITALGMCMLYSEICL